MGVEQATPRSQPTCSGPAPNRLIGPPAQITSPSRTFISPPVKWKKSITFQDLVSHKGLCEKNTERHCLLRIYHTPSTILRCFTRINSFIPPQ